MSGNTILDQTREAIARDLKAAMTARQNVRIAALRRALALLDNATAPSPAQPTAPVAASGIQGPDMASEISRRTVTAHEIETLLLSEIGDHAEAAAEYQRLNRPERAQRLDAEAEAIRGCLQHLRNALAGGAR